MSGAFDHNVIWALIRIKLVRLRVKSVQVVIGVINPDLTLSVASSARLAIFAFKVQKRRKCAQQATTEINSVQE